MADLRLEVEGNEFSLEALSDNGLQWLRSDTESIIGPRTFRVPQLGERIFFPLNTQDIIIHELQDDGLVIYS